MNNKRQKVSAAPTDAAAAAADAAGFILVIACTKKHGCICRKCRSHEDEFLDNDEGFLAALSAMDDSAFAPPPPAPAPAPAAAPAFVTPPRASVGAGPCVSACAGVGACAGVCASVGGPPCPLGLLFNKTCHKKGKPAPAMYGRCWHDCCMCG